MKILMYLKFIVVAIATFFTISKGLSALIIAIKSSCFILLGVAMATTILGTSLYFLHEMSTGKLEKISSHAGSATLIYVGTFVYNFGYGFLIHQELATGAFAIAVACILWYLAFKYF